MKGDRGCPILPRSLRKGGNRGPLQCRAQLFPQPVMTRLGIGSSSTPCRLLRSPAHPPVHFGSSSLGRAPRCAANPSQPRRHPSPRPQKSLQQTRQVKVRIQLRKVNAQAGWADLDFIQLRRFGIFQSLRVTRRKTYVEPRTQVNNNAPAGPVIPRRDRPWTRRLHPPTPLVRLFKPVKTCHECSPMPHKAIPHDSLERARCVRFPAARIRSSPNLGRPSRAFQIEYCLRSSSDHMHVGWPVIVWVNHHAQSIKSQNCRHNTIVSSQPFGLLQIARAQHELTRIPRTLKIFPQPPCDI
jgi:hypothetical protein